MKNLRKWISLALCLALLLALLPQTAVKAHADSFSGDDRINPNLHWSYDAGTGVLTYSGSGPMQDGGAYGYDFGWDAYRADIHTVILPEGLTSIGWAAFHDCTNLEIIEIPETVTSITGYAFSNCASLKKIVLPNSMLPYGEHGTEGLFDGCSSLNDIRIPSTWTELPYAMFLGCTGLTEYTVPDNIIGIGGCAFCGCTGLTEIVIPDSVTSIGSAAFQACSNLQRVSLGSGLQTVELDSFGDCAQLTELHLNTPTVESWFSSMESIATVEFGEHVTTIGYGAFACCTGLTEVIIPDGVTTIMDEAFAGCSGLQRVRLGSGLEYVGTTAFSGCDQLAEVHLNTPTVGNWFQNRSSLTTVVLGEQVTAIGSYAFYGCTGLTGIALPDSVTGIGSYAFYGCTGLTELTLPASITKIGESLFAGCGNLQTMTIREGVTDIGNYAFSGCEKLDGVVLPESLETIGIEAFRGCSMLQAITIPANVEVVDDNAFKDCGALKDITVTNGRCQIEYRRNTLGSYKTTVIHGYRNSTAHYYARAYAYDFEITEREEPCQEEQHDWGEWTPVEDAPAAVEEETSTCYVCGHTRTRFAGGSDIPFRDVPKDAYYYAPVLWATGRTPAVTLGTDPTHFSPAASCTRAQVVTFLWRAMGQPTPAQTVNTFTDVKEEAYYRSAVLWAMEQGVTQGTDETHFNPNAPCTRAQAVTFLWRALGKQTPESSDCPFVDVSADRYYYIPVLWAFEKGITLGVDAAHFNPNLVCSRADVITFLFRALVDGQ